MLSDRTMRLRLHSYIAEVSNNLRCTTLSVGGVADHVHLLAELASTRSQSEWVREVKARSSAWMNSGPPQMNGFSWQRGYATFSLEAANREKCRRYIETQEEHHKVLSYKDELLKLLEEQGVAYDERYLWD